MRRALRAGTARYGGAATVAGAAGLVAAAVAVAWFGWTAGDALRRERAAVLAQDLARRADAEAASGAARLREAVVKSRTRGDLRGLGVAVDVVVTQVPSPADVADAPELRAAEHAEAAGGDAPAALARWEELSRQAGDPGVRVAAHRATARLLAAAGRDGDAATHRRAALDEPRAPARETWLARFDVARADRANADAAPSDDATAAFAAELATRAGDALTPHERLAMLRLLDPRHPALRDLAAAAVAVDAPVDPGDGSTRALLAGDDALVWRLPGAAGEVRVARAPWPAAAVALLPGLADGTFELAADGGRPLPAPFPVASWRTSDTARGAADDDAAHAGVAMRTPALALAAVLFGGALLLLRAGRARADLAQRRDDFLCAVTHELKTPVANVLLSAETLRTHGKDDPQSVPRFAGIVAAEALRLDARIQELLAVAAGRRAPRAPGAQETCDVRAVVDDVVRVFGPRFAAASMRLDVDVAAQVGATCGTRELLARALGALLENALRFAPGSAVSLTCRADATHVRLAVRDGGPGVAAADRERIFEPFERGPDVQRDAVPGTGLGLAVARRAVLECGGTLVCRAASPAPGAEFVIELPRAPRAVS